MTKEQLINKDYQFNDTFINGTLKWTDKRDGEAVLKDSQGNEYYCESSSSPEFDFGDNKTREVIFEVAIIPQYGPMAWNAKQIK